MPIILLVEKTGNIKPQKIQDTDFANLYKKAGYKTNEGDEFRQHTTWTVEGKKVALYGKNKGKAGMENKYDFPPPVDTTLFFGSCILTGVDATGKMEDLKLETWNHMYEVLFGGFEDLDGDSDDEETELDTDDEIEMLRETAKEQGVNVIIKKTRDGYINDGFVVDTDEGDSSFVETESSEEEEEEPPKKKSKKAQPIKKKAAKIHPEKKETAPRKNKKNVVEEEPVSRDVYMDCTEELEEEEYL